MAVVLIYTARATARTAVSLVLDQPHATEPAVGSTTGGNPDTNICTERGYITMRLTWHASEYGMKWRRSLPSFSVNLLYRMQPLPFECLTDGFFFFFLLHCHKPLGQKAIMYICTCMHVHLDSFSGSATGKSLWVRLNRSWLDCHQSRRSDAWSGFLLLSVTMDTCVMCLDIYRERYEASPHLLFESFVLEGFNVQRTEATSVVEYGREE